ncbi:MAG: ABC transporter substrate-binding protein [Clostridiales bacterium]|nr:ABC transporter substrate-binding protein [Clostridiales bacterium]
MKKYISLFLVISIIVGCFCGCTSQNDDSDASTTTEATTAKITDNTTFKLSYTQSDSLDPFEAETQNNQILASLVFESLFDLDESFEPVLNIATSYSFIDSTTLQVNINPQLTFSDGSALGTDDVVYSAKAAMDSPAYGNSLDCISSVYADGNSVIFTLEYANPNAVNLLTFPIASTDDVDGFPIGNGRYRYAQSDGKTLLKANVSDSFDPYITTINLVNIAAADSIDNAVNIGNISFAFRDLSSSVSKRMSCAKKTVTMNNLVFLGINSSSGITANAQIRKAISLAVDRDTLVESAYSGYADAATSLFHPSYELSENAELFSSTADVATAKQAVSQSGIEEEKLELTILVNNNDNRTAAANLIKTQLESVGFTVTIKKEKYKKYKTDIKNLNFDLYIGEIKLSDDMCLYPFFSDDGNVRYGIDTDEFTCDDLYSDYLSGDVELGKFILSFNEEMPYIPLLYKRGMICYSKAMKGDMQGYYGNFFSNIESWNFTS